MTSILCPPPNDVTEMLLSVLSPKLKVPTWVGCRRISGGALVVNFGSQRIAREVVSWLATVRVLGAVGTLRSLLWRLLLLLELLEVARDACWREVWSAVVDGGT